MINAYRARILSRVARKFRGGRIKKKTASERVFEALLEELGLGFVPQAIFLKSGSTFYIVDFYIKSPYKLIVEIDGDDHRIKKRQVRDLKKDRYFRANNYGFLRLSDAEVLGSPAQVRTKLKECVRCLPINA